MAWKNVPTPERNTTRGKNRVGTKQIRLYIMTTIPAHTDAIPDFLAFLTSSFV